MDFANANIGGALSNERCPSMAASAFHSAFSWCPVQKYVCTDGQLLFSFSFSILACSTNPAYEVACKAG